MDNHMKIKMQLQLHL